MLALIQGSTDRQLLVLVQYGLRFSKLCWFWSVSVRNFQIFLGPGPVKLGESERFKGRQFFIIRSVGPFTRTVEAFL